MPITLKFFISCMVFAFFLRSSVASINRIHQHGGPKLSKKQRISPSLKVNTFGMERSPLSEPGRRPVSVKSLDTTEADEGLQFKLGNHSVRDISAPHLYRRTTSVGGGGGRSFDDSEVFFAAQSRIASIEVRHGRHVDAINIHYSSGESETHGGNGGSRSFIRLDSDERIVAVAGKSGRLLDRIAFISDRRSYGPYGGHGGHDFRFDFGSNSLVYVFGRSGRLVDNIGFGYGPQACEPPVRVSRELSHGGGGGRSWDDLRGQSAERRITSIVIRHGRFIDGIQINYGSHGPHHGGRGGRRSVLHVGPEESIIKVQGRSGRLVDQLQFFFDSGRVSPVYGGRGGRSFTIEPNNAVITAFYGRSGRLLDRIGAYSVAGLPYRLEMLSIEYDLSTLFFQPGTPQGARTVTLVNNNGAAQQVSQTATVSATTSTTVTSSFSRTESTQISFSTQFQGQVIRVSQGITIGNSFTTSFSESRTVSETVTESYTFVANVAPHSTLRGTAVARTAIYNLPYSSTARVWRRGNQSPETIAITGTIDGLAITSIEATYN